MSELVVKDCAGADIGDNLEALARLRIRVFREYPYLYDGTLAYEKKYLKMYLASPRSFIAVCLDGTEIVGATTCLPLEDAEEAFHRPFVEKKYDPKVVFYFGESVLLPQYRGRGVGGQFMRRRLKHAMSFPEVKYASFCSVIKPADHPQKPAEYWPLDLFWEKVGFKKKTDLVTSYKWKDVGEKKETSKPMQFWVKELR